ncbi:MAG: hypothetical protein Q8P24_06015 [Desulfobacterales bacterium]|nr:hypothetical protein [Desulfobacterales bacterium]
MGLIISFMQAVVFFFIFLSFSFPAAADEPYAFKDIELGSHITKVYGEGSFRCAKTNSPFADKSCRLADAHSGEESIGGIPVSNVSLYYVKDNLTSIVITFAGKHFNTVRDAIKKRYGAYRHYTTETYVDGIGELFEGYVYEWDNKVSMIDAIQHFSRRNNSAVLYQLSSYFTR